jgi:hypothetical protein
VRWHRSDARKEPDYIYLLKLPPCAPQLKPIEHVQDELGQKFFHNRVFKSLDALQDPLIDSQNADILFAQLNANDLLMSFVQLLQFLRFCAFFFHNQ